MALGEFRHQLRRRIARAVVDDQDFGVAGALAKADQLRQGKRQASGFVISRDYDRKSGQEIIVLCPDSFLLAISASQPAHEETRSDPAWPRSRYLPLPAQRDQRTAAERPGYRRQSWEG